MNAMPDPQSLTLGGLFISSFIIGLSGAVMPGPVLAVTITHAARLGVRAGPLIIAGHAILEASLLLALVLGLGAILTQPTVSGLVGGVGAVILLWMGMGMLRALPSLTLDMEATGARAAGPVRDGFLLSLANPYWSLWWATVGLSLMAVALKSGLGYVGIVFLFLGHISGDFLWYLAVALVVAKGRRFLTDRLHRGVVGVCALFLLGFALYFGFFAWEQLRAAWA